MNTRRKFLQDSGHLAVLGLAISSGIVPAQSALAQAWNKGAFEGKSLNEVVKALGGVSAAPSGEVAFFDTPEIAENGAVVPIGVQSKLANTQSIAILVEKNPNALAAAFEVPAGTAASVKTRVKMGQSSNIHALVKADGKYFVATKEVKVTLGGCGG